MLRRRVFRSLVALAAFAALAGALAPAVASIAWPRYRVVGPLPATPAGRVLRVRDLAGRQRELALPELPAGTTVWVDALLRSGRLEARPIARPR